MKTYTASTACCATCANWSGPRTATHGGSYVEVDSVSTEGRCSAGTNSTSKGNASCYKCAKYQKWSSVK